MLIGLSVLIGCMILGLPIYLSLLCSGFYVLWAIGVPLSFVTPTLYDGVFKFVLLAVPFFLFAGALIEKTAFSKELIRYTISWTKRIPGGIALSGVLANEFFGAVSGSSPAATGTVGRLLFPVISEAEGESFALGLLTSCGALAIIMPPSITMILYGAVTNTSVGKLFIAGIIPAFIVGGFLTAYCVSHSRPAHRTRKREDAVGTQESVLCAKKVLSICAVLFLPVLVLGGIYAGIYTPTESAAIAVCYVAGVSRFLLKDLNLSAVWSALTEALKLTAQIFVVVAAASVFSQALTMAQVPQQLIKLCTGLSPYTFLIILNVLLLFVGMFFDPASAVLVLSPIVAPIADNLGIDLIHLGIVITVNIAIGMFTPPFGLNLFVSQAVFNKPLERIVRTLPPFIGLYLLALSIITFLPRLYMWLPKMVMG
jgi:C4-dicarboxylate transporter, DctM subunit